MSVGMATVTVTGNGQVVIPAKVRKALGIVPGVKLEFRVEGRGLRAEVLRSRTAPRLGSPSRLEDGIGMLRPARPTQGRLLDFDIAEAMKRGL